VTEVARSYDANPDDEFIVGVSALPASGYSRDDLMKCDGLLFERLVEQGFSGAQYDELVDALVRYSLPVMKAWIRSGRIFSLSARAGRPLYGREVVMDAEDIGDLATDTIMGALRLFREAALSGNGWKSDGGATLASYFMGACVRVFPNSYRSWWNWRRRVDRIVCLDIPEERDDSTPESEVLSAEYAASILRKLPPRVAEIIVLRSKGYSNTEIGALMETTPRAIEGMLYRFRTGMKSVGRQSE
jgi:DNA-directed RNA polymerase specialized sigma24 family protein